MHTSVVLNIVYTTIVLSSMLVSGNVITNQRQVCQSEEFQAVSDYIRSKLDTSVDPCQDMYQFSCGRWPNMSKVGNDVALYSMFEEVQNNIHQQLVQILQEESSMFRCKNSSSIRKLKDLYRSCMNYENNKSEATLSFIELIDSYGSWTVTKTRLHWDEENWNLQKALSKAHKIWGTSFWTVNVKKDVNNSFHNIISFQPSGLTLSDYEDCTIQEDFVNQAIQIGELLGGDKEIIKEKTSQVLAFERKLAKINVPMESMQNIESFYKLMTLSEFQKLLGSWIDMEGYMKDLFGTRKFTLNDEVIITTPDYFSKLNKIIQETSKETIANYVMWNFIMQARQNLPAEKNFNARTSLSTYAEKGQKKLLSENVNDLAGDRAETYTNGPNATGKLNQRQMDCIIKAKESLPFLTSALFVDKNLSVETINKIVTAIDDIEHEFINELQVITWLDDKTRKILIEKAKSMSNKVGYPDWILNPEKLDAKYENVVIHESDFLKNMVHIKEFERKKEFQSYFKSPDKKEWTKYPEDVNAYYITNENEMLILAGYLQSPLVSPYYPRSFLYGGIGPVLGHELVHGFDNTGRLYDKEGKYGDTWTPHVAEEFTRRAQCFVDQYSSYSVYNKSVNGNLTLGENIADNGGMKIAYRAYQSSINPHDFSLPGLDFTDDQLFFIGSSQFWCEHVSKRWAMLSLDFSTHSPNKYRVIGTMSNSKEFAEAFKCDKNTPMNPEKKCEIW